jgi:DNA polymerase III delta prime subunit
MPELLADEVLRLADEATSLYHRLVLVVGPPGSGKTPTLQEAARRTGGSVINANLELSRLMLDLTVKQRALQVGRLLAAIVAEADGDPVLLDNTEMLFDPVLRQDPLRLLQSVSRGKTVVAAWNGKVDGNRLVYAQPGHPEHRHYPAEGLCIAVAAPSPRDHQHTSEQRP